MKYDPKSEPHDSLYVSGRFLSGLLDYVRGLHCDTSPVLVALGASAPDLMQRDGIVPHALQDLAFDAAEQTTGDAHVGLHAGSAASIALFGIVGQLALTCRTGAELIDVATRYHAMIGNGIRMTCVRREQTIQLRFQPCRRPIPRHVMVYSLAAQLALARLVAGPQLRPCSVFMPYPKPPDACKEASYFGCEVYYGADQARLLFPCSLDQLPLSGSDPGVSELLEAAAGELLRARQVRQHQGCTDAALCHSYIVAGLDCNAHTKEAVARRMNISGRTLQRRLLAQGTSFRKLEQASRRALTELLLSNPSLPLTEVAQEIGFSGASTLSRATRRWFGMTPKELRNRRRLHLSTGVAQCKEGSPA